MTKKLKKECEIHDIKIDTYWIKTTNIPWMEFRGSCKKCGKWFWESRSVLDEFKEWVSTLTIDWKEQR